MWFNIEEGGFAALLLLLGLIAFDQLANAKRVRLAVAVAGDRGGAARGINTDFGPDHSRRNPYRGDLSQSDALFAAAEQAGLEPAHVLRRNDDAHRKEEIAPGPTA